MPPAKRTQSPARRTKAAADEKKRVEAVIADALQEALNAKAADPVEYVGRLLCGLSDSGGNGKPAAAAPVGAHGGGGESDDDISSYATRGALALAGQRTGWLLIFLVGLLLCTFVMSSFEHLLSKQPELSFFVPLLVGHGGNMGGQTVSTVIRALGSGAVRMEDAPSVIAKEAIAGVLQSLVLVSALTPVLIFAMGTSAPVSTVVALTMPCIGLLANTVGSTLPFAITWLGQDPAVIVGPLMTTSVDTLGIISYLTIATLYLDLA